MASSSNSSLDGRDDSSSLDDGADLLLDLRPPRPETTSDQHPFASLNPLIEIMSDTKKDLPFTKQDAFALVDRLFSAVSRPSETKDYKKRKFDVKGEEKCEEKHAVCPVSSLAQLETIYTNSVAESSSNQGPSDCPGHQKINRKRYNLTEKLFVVDLCAKKSKTAMNIIHKIEGKVCLVCIVCIACIRKYTKHTIYTIYTIKALKT